MPSETAERLPRPRRRGRSAAKEQPTAIVLRHPGGERRKRIRLGFAWDLFLLSGLLFGLPLFLRRLPQWGAAMLALWVIDLLVSRFAPGAQRPTEVALFCAFLALQIWLGLKGNGLTARAYLRHGWTVEDAREPEVKRALARWRLG
ncbi:MAG TPA: hypothetical protein VN832_03460 [Stellaceae bacterium]|nr:hypothetical protein [Stellaceae bacterium]